MLIFDIETEPLPDDHLRELCPPYTPPPHPGEFDAASVKIGNLKDQAKINAKISEAAAAHDRAVERHDEDCRQGEIDHFAEFRDRAALDAVTGRVLVIGLYSAGSGKAAFLDASDPADEYECLMKFWCKYADCRAKNVSMVGVNIHEFDLPFMVRRSWMLGAPVPSTLMVNSRYWDDMFVDLTQRYYLGQRNGKPSGSFDALAAAFGTAGKPDGVSGKDFSRLWREDRPAAEAYLLNDLKQPAIWAEKMGVV